MFLHAFTMGPDRMRLFAFRLAFAYLVIYNLPFPLDYLPGAGALVSAYEGAWRALVPWVAEHLLRLPEPITVFPNGSGDTTFNYVQLLCFAVLSLVTVGLWSALDARSTAHPRLARGLRVYIRYALALAMLGYGFAKVIKTQFSDPSLDRLLHTYGDSSPMGLVWTFMGYSTAYNVFTGGAEVLGGLLLLFGRTTMLGALVSIAVMSNVFMLNMCFDVPVKLYSFHLLLMAVYLVAPDLRRLANFLVFNRPVAPAPLEPAFASPRLRRLLTILKLALVCWVVVTPLRNNWEYYRRSGDGAPKPPLYGLYDVRVFTADGAVKPPLITDASRWRTVIVDRRMVVIRGMNEERQSFRYEHDASARRLTLTGFGGPAWSAEFKITPRGTDGLTLEGNFYDRPLVVELARIDHTQLELTRRGFHWINEYPYYR